MTPSNSSIFDMTPGARMLLFIALTGLSMVLGGFVSFSIVAAILHVGLRDIQSILLQPEYTSITQFANALASIIGFGLPTFLVAYFTNGRIIDNLGFNTIKNKQQVLLVIALALVGLMLSGTLGDLTEKIPIPNNFEIYARQMEEQYKKAVLAMTQMNSWFDLLFAIIAVAVIPAIVEELYFRAGLQKILMDLSGKPYLAIIITAVVFSTFHFSYFGFLSRMSLGIILGCIYYFTKTIWLPILMHFINNGIGITVLFLIRNDPKKVATVLEGNLTYYWVVVAFAGAYFILKALKNYSDDARLGESI